MLKANLYDGFYHIGLRPDNAPKLGLFPPGTHGGEQLVALPLILPMGWKNLPPLFCTTMETTDNMANASLKYRT